MKKTIWFVGIIVLLIAIFAGIVYIMVSNNSGGEYKNYSNMEEFSKCLTDKSLVMYGAYWCPHCQNQKKNFGDYFKNINYVECGDDTSKCVAKGVEGFPTWITKDGQKLVGEQTFENLSEVSGCPLVKVSK